MGRHVDAYTKTQKFSLHAMGAELFYRLADIDEFDVFRVLN